ncbi:MAG: PD40 domain-containing protein [Polyangiaceae bacterium]|nr:PD40 domain-containing protein [Polyangiaceae bacterium]
MFAPGCRNSRPALSGILALAAACFVPACEVPPPKDPPANIETRSQACIEAAKAPEHALDLARQGKLHRARRVLEKAIQTCPTEDPTALEQLGEYNAALYNAPGLEKIIATLEASKTPSPNLPNLKKALQDIAREPTQNERAEAQAALERGYLALEKQDTRAAVSEFVRATNLVHDNPRAFTAAGLAAEAVGQVELAQTHFDRAYHVVQHLTGRAPLPSIPALIVPRGQRYMAVQNNLQILAVTQRNSILLFDRLLSFRPMALLEGHSAPINDVRFSPDQTLSASSADDGTVRIWNTNAQLVSTLSANGGEAFGIAFSPDSQTVAAGYRDGKARLWNIKTGSLVQTYSGHQKTVESVAFSADGKLLATGSWDGTVRLWDVQKGTSVRTIGQRGEQVTAVAFSPDGQWIASCNTQWINEANLNRLQIFRTKDGVRVRDLEDQAPAGMISFSPDGKMITAASRRDSVAVWNLKDGKLKYVLKHPPSENGTFISTSTFAEGGNTVVTSGTDGTIRFWNAENGSETRVISQPKPQSFHGFHITFLPDGNLAVGNAEKIFTHWNLKQHRVTQKQMGKEVFAVHKSAVSPDGKVLASGGYGEVNLWNTGSGELQGTLPGAKHYIDAMAFSPNQKRFAASSYDKIVYIWNLDTGKLDCTLQNTYGAIHAIQFSADGSTVVFSGSDNRAYVANVAECTQTRELTGHGGAVPATTISADGALVVTGSDDKLIRIFQAKTGSLLQTLAGHTEPVTAVQLSPDGKILVSGSNDKTVRVWNVETGAPIGVPMPHTASVASIAFSPNGKHVAALGADGNILTVTAAGEPLVTLTFLPHSNAGYSFYRSPPTHVELWGEAAAKNPPSCVAGSWIFPYEVCREQVSAPGLTNTVFAGELNAFEP